MISTDLVEIVVERSTTARATCLAIKTHFLDYRETRALYLDAEFRNFIQGNLFITKCCQRFKSMANALIDLGEFVSDHTLIINVLRGLNQKFAPIGLHLQRGHPFPMFLQACFDLVLMEIMLANKSSALAPSFVTSSSTGPSTSSGAAPRPPRPLYPQQPYYNEGGSRATSTTGVARRRRPNLRVVVPLVDSKHLVVAVEAHPLALGQQAC